MNIKALFMAGALAFGATVAGAATVATNCGTIADGAASNCGSFNLAVHNTEFAFEALLSDEADHDGSLTIETYVDPFQSTGYAAGNIELALVGGLPVGGMASLTFGGAPVALTLSGNSLVSGVITAFYPGSGAANGLDLVLSWSGLSGGEQISIRVSAVPLPAGVLLMGTALGGLGLARRRKKAA